MKGEKQINLQDRCPVRTAVTIKGIGTKVTTVVGKSIEETVSLVYSVLIGGPVMVEALENRIEVVSWERRRGGGTMEVKITPWVLSQAAKDFLSSPFPLSGVDVTICPFRPIRVSGKCTWPEVIRNVHRQELGYSPTGCVKEDLARVEMGRYNPAAKALLLFLLPKA